MTMVNWLETQLNRSRGNDVDCIIHSQRKGGREREGGRKRRIRNGSKRDGCHRRPSEGQLVN